jgi:hypothetical protein
MKNNQAQNVTVKYLDPIGNGNCFFSVMSCFIAGSTPQTLRERFCDWAKNQKIPYPYDSHFPQVKTWDAFKKNPEKMLGSTKPWWMAEEMIELFSNFSGRKIFYTKYDHQQNIAEIKLCVPNQSSLGGMYDGDKLQINSNEVNIIHQTDLKNTICLVLDGSSHYQGIINARTSQALTSDEIKSVLPNFIRLGKTRVDGGSDTQLKQLMGLETTNGISTQQTVNNWLQNKHQNSFTKANANSTTTQKTDYSYAPPKHTDVFNDLTPEDLALQLVSIKNFEKQKAAKDEEASIALVQKLVQKDESLNSVYPSRAQPKPLTAKVQPNNAFTQNIPKNDLKTEEELLKMFKRAQTAKDEEASIALAQQLVQEDESLKSVYPSRAQPKPLTAKVQPNNAFTQNIPKNDLKTEEELLERFARTNQAAKDLELANVLQSFENQKHQEDSDAALAFQMAEELNPLSGNSYNWHI